MTRFLPSVDMTKNEGVEMTKKAGVDMSVFLSVKLRHYRPVVALDFAYRLIVSFIFSAIGCFSFVVQ